MHAGRNAPPTGILMRLLSALLVAICLNAHATPAQDYLQRFNAYSRWNEKLPQQPDNSFLTFIDNDKPLAKKLREKWLYQLAYKKDWVTFYQHYKPSDDIALQCFAHLAGYYQGQVDGLLQAAKTLWLSGDSNPGACTPLFEIWINSSNFDERLISERIALALEKGNLPLARYLLKRYRQPRLKDENLLVKIHQNPSHIAELNPGELHDVFYLYGLKRMVAAKMEQAIAFWQRPQTRKLLSEAQQQSFIAHVALYKAIRDHEDAELWFAKVKPRFYDDVLLEWKIRLALKREQWNVVEQYIHHIQDKDNPCWQYWLARAKDETGQKEEALQIWESIAKTRHYYGFLSSLRINKNFSFQNESSRNNRGHLAPWQPFINTVRQLYQRQQKLQASRLLNDFLLELSKEDKIALISWVDNDLQWHGKSVYLSNDKELNNQLSLRFPIPFENRVSAYAKNFHIPTELVYAIIRQESGFREDVVSSAGALGLMQVMPATATVVAKAEKIPYSHKTQLFSSQKNINIGIAYLKYLARHFSANPVLMAAAYNAGPKQVNYWLKNHPPREVDLWIETLPWHETRNYLKNIISFYVVYQFRLQHHSDLSELMKSL